MLEGRRPFEGTSPIAVIGHHLKSDLPVLKTVVPKGVRDLVCADDQQERRGAPWLLRRAVGPDRGVAGRRGAWGVDAGATLDTPASRLSPGARPGLSLVLWWDRTESSVDREESRTVRIAVAPFVGPDPESTREGESWPPWWEKASAERLGDDAVLGLAETSPVRRSDELDGWERISERAWSCGATPSWWEANRRFSPTSPWCRQSGRGRPAGPRTAGPALSASWRPIVWTRTSSAFQGTGEIELRKSTAEEMGDLGLVRGGPLPPLSAG